MTKINKLGKSTFVIAILSFLLVAVLAFGGTYAYFSAQAKTVGGTITTGHLRIPGVITSNSINAETAALKIDDAIAQPNQNIVNDTFSVAVNSNIAYYTRVKFTVSVEVADGHTNHVSKDADGNTITCMDTFTSALQALTIGTNGNVETDNSGWLAGADSAATGSATSASTSKYFYKLKATRPTPGTDNAAVDSTETFKVVVKVNPQVGTTTGSAAGCDYWMDAEITISISFEVLQADYLNASEGDAATAVEFTTGEQAETAWTKALTGAQA